MREYEVRILRSDLTSAMLIELMHLNDHAAVRAAKKMAEGRPFEVWCGLDCIYDGTVAAPDPSQPHTTA